ncbi:autotransporter domain-containing protein [Caulobacter endophyticus]|uniref:autotransporter domain-containing protein n=1 Tax=Caulobacter endophyticus TaxID=2172652 RepID=UPI00241020F9|nr:autotransporter domain-containing protein [Caulobacter endophyticus]MDG2529013.1 autotransporter domain-containing protein [Caulobacter endophyticus]
MRQSFNKVRAFNNTRVIRSSISLTVLALAVGLGAPMVQARQITQGGGAGAGYSPHTPQGGIAGGGGGASGAGSYGGSAAGTPTGSAEAGAGGAGGQPGALNDLSAGGGGAAGAGAGGDGGLGWQLATTGTTSLAVDYIATDGANGGASAAGGGGGGGLVLTGANVQLSTAGYDVTGGDGGAGSGGVGGGGGGGGGGAGLVLLNGGSVTVNGGAGGSASAITGGTGSSFGNGGAGLFLYSGGALNVVSGTITGGAGGTFASWAGAGAAGVLSNLGTITNAGTITGGEGGYGYSNGGAAGIGVIAWGGSIENSATGLIAGGVGGRGNGGSGSNYSGAGGAGIVFTGGQPGLLVNAGTIQGGAGGPASNAIRRGAGGRGVVGASTGSTTIINSGTIIGGVSVNFQRAYAIELFGSDNRLELHAGSWIRDVTAVTGGGSNNVLALGGADDDTFDAMHIGSDGSVDGYGYMGFDTFEKLGASTWTLTGTGNQTWSVREGVLKGDSNSLAGDVVFVGGAGSRGVVFDQAFDGVYAGRISSGGTVTKAGAGTLTLSGEIASDWTISGGGVIAGARTLGGDATIAAGAFLTLDQVSDATYGHVLSGAGEFRKAGSGKLILTGDSSGFTGSTTVGSGTLSVNGSLSGSTFTVASGATLAGSGTVGAVTVQSGGRLAPGNSVGSLSIDGDLTLASGASLDIELGASGASSASSGVSDRVVVSGDLALNGVVNLSQSAALADGLVGVGYYRLITYGGTLTASTAVIGATPSQAGLGYELQTGGGRVDLFVSNAFIVGDDTLQHWQGGDGVWSAAATQWLNQGGNAPTNWAGKHAIFKDAAGFAGGLITMRDAQSFQGLQFVDEGYELTGAGQLVTVSTGSEIRVLSDEARIGAAITGAGGVIKTEAGTLILTGANSYAGGTSIQAGTLQIGDGGASGSIVGDVVNKGVLAFDRSDSATFGGLVSGSGAVRILGGGVTLTANNTYAGGTAIASGALLKLGAGGATGSIAGDVVANGALVFDRSDSLTFGGTISGAGRLRQVGAGRTQLTGGSAGFTGATTVEQGTLVVNGQLGGTLDVWAGARLQGVGTVGTTVVSGTIAPGNSIGTLNVAGGVTFKTGSVFEVEANAAGQADRIVASGVATIQGGAVRVLAGAGTYRPETSYVILHADGGLAAGSRFDGVTSNLAFLDPSLSYDASNVYLRLRRNDISFADIGATPNQAAVGGGAEALGWNSPVFVAVVNLSADQARDAFDQLAGSDYAGLRGSLIQDSRFVRDAILGRGDLAGAEGRSAWGQAFGGWGSMKGDGNAQSYDRDIQGLLTGYDGSLGRDIRAGVAVGYSGGDLKTTRATHDVETYHLGGYVLAERGGLSFQLGGAYAWHDVKASRRVAFGTFGEALSSDYSARTYQAFGEVAVKRELAGATVQPFAGLAYVALSDADVSEQGGGAVLHGGGDQHLTYGSIGVRLKSDLSTGELGLRLTGSVALRHAFGDRAPTIDLAFSGASPFRVAGAPIDKDSLAVNLGMEADLARSVVLGVTYSGDYGDRATDHGARAQLSWRF